MAFSRHTNNRANNIHVLGKDFIQGVNGATIYPEKMYKTNFTEQDKKFILSLHYNGDDSYLFVNGIQQLKLKTKSSEIKRLHLSLGNISTDFSTTNATKTGLYGNVYNFPVGYVPISGVKTIYDIHRYLMKKMILYKMFSIIKNVLVLVLMLVASLLVLTNSSTKCISLKNQECKVREIITDNKYMAFPYNIKVNRCSGSCNNITNPYVKVCIPDIIKNATVKCLI